MVKCEAMHFYINYEEIVFKYQTTYFMKNLLCEVYRKFSHAKTFLFSAKYSSWNKDSFENSHAQYVHEYLYRYVSDVSIAVI